MSGDDDNKAAPGSKRGERTSGPAAPHGDASPPASTTNNNQSGGLNAPHSAVNVGRDLIAGSQTVHHNYYGEGPGEPPWSPSPPLRRYLDWLKRKPMTAHLRGVGGADLPLDLRRIYVPLSLRQHMREDYVGGRRRGPMECDGGEFEIADLFARLDGRRHAILLGDPGSGKTTALRKLALLVGEEARRAAGEDVPEAGDGKDTQILAGSLERGVVPVFVRLRGLTGRELDLPLQRLVARELERVSEGVIDVDTFEGVWSHGRLLLLLDGLDEIADASDRAAFCARLNAFHLTFDHAAVRVVVSCRFNGYRDLAVKLDGGFGRVEVQPLSKEQARTLITRWFREAATALPGLSERAADAQARHLADALDDSRFADQRRSMYATPLILTLLCVVCQRGHAIPENRVVFYEKCLEVFLEGWHLGKRDSDEAAPEVARPPLGLEAMIEVLRPVAYTIHASPKRDQHGRNGVILEIRRRLKRLGVELDPALLFEWLCERAGVLEELSPGEFGFFHLGVQEYLAALHVASEGGRRIEELARRLGDSWWSEVILMAGAVPRLGAFGPLMDGLLERADLGDEPQRRLLRDAVREAIFDPSPFVRFLATTSRSAAEIEAVLTIVRDMHFPELAAAARALAGRTGDAGLRGAALQFAEAIDRRSRGQDGALADVAVVGMGRDRGAVEEVLTRLRQTPSLRVWPESGVSPPLEALDWEAMMRATSQVVLVLAARAPWEMEGQEDAVARLSNLAAERPLTVVGMGSSEVSFDAVPEEVEAAPRLTLPGEWDVLVRRVRPGAGAEEVVPGGPVVGRLVRVVKQVCVEPLTGMRFLYVPEGVFRMGSEALDNDSRPEHLVRVPEFWIGETPVTNRIYRLFVAEKGWREPGSWRDRRFGDPEQPVVTVSWDDAKAFCAWMSQETRWAVGLPSEAQWEYAARGTDGRPYPWGWEEPDATRCHFDQGDEGQPAAVGSYPAGMGPFGALDQAGNVWEWCEDVWNPNAYRERKRPPEVNEARVVTTGPDKGVRSLRGGSWYRDNSRGALAATFRYCYWHDSIVGRGFRVVAAREPG